MKLHITEAEKIICDYPYMKDLQNHQVAVSDLLLEIMDDLDDRRLNHDRSKEKGIERELLSKAFLNLRNLEYGSKEYKENLESIKPAIEEHYKNNRHHPEHYLNGIDGMDLVDLMEMFADWSASIRRNKNGNLMKSLEINRVRFNMSDQLYNIFRNTAERYFEEEEQDED